ncbi:kinase-like domain-containing protein [Mycena sp. CBHHK59/15]|nr:kinase-like domain-containing protein [Mycena sp. CBHHK59/15]
MSLFAVSVLFCVGFALLLWRTRYHPSKLAFGSTGDHTCNCDPEWARSADFLLRHGVALSGTNAYREMLRAPSHSALFPFVPGKDEAFVHSWVQRPPRDRDYNHISPLIRLAVDSMGRHVLVKAVPEASQEWRIIGVLTSLNYDPQNHTIPVVDILHCDGTAFIVQARWGDQPLYPSLNVREWVMVAYQLLEGLVFMHKHGIGHGDLHIGNIVCNYHSLRSEAERCPAYAAFKKSSSFRMAFIDFGTSVQFSGEAHSVPHRPFVGPSKPYRSPEQDDGNDFDLFAADVYGLGQIIRAIAPTTIPAYYDAVIGQMTSPDPSIRPSARAALACLMTAIEHAGVDDDSDPI